MEAGYHLKDQEVVSVNIMQVSKFWSVLSEEDKEYIQAAKIAIRDKPEWTISNHSNCLLPSIF
tara:strand:+ start:197 stop:385 length:189 start_codon:yes stop_codon:yes gene_type:complete